mgnify:CR=1 FL=1
MKLYTYDPAPSPQRLAQFMKYKGIEIETQQIDMMGGEHLSDEYRAIVPERTVPALVLDDGTVFAEATAATSTALTSANMVLIKMLFIWSLL